MTPKIAGLLKAHKDITKIDSMKYYVYKKVLVMYSLLLLLIEFNPFGYNIASISIGVFTFVFLFFYLLNDLKKIKKSKIYKSIKQKYNLEKLSQKEKDDFLLKIANKLSNEELVYIYKNQNFFKRDILSLAAITMDKRMEKEFDTIESIDLETIYKAILIKDLPEKEKIKKTRIKNV